MRYRRRRSILSVRHYKTQSHFEGHRSERDRGPGILSDLGRRGAGLGRRDHPGCGGGSRHLHRQRLPVRDLRLVPRQARLRQREHGSRGCAHGGRQGGALYPRLPSTNPRRRNRRSVIVDERGIFHLLGVIFDRRLDCAASRRPDQYLYRPRVAISLCGGRGLARSHYTAGLGSRDEERSTMGG